MKYVFAIIAGLFIGGLSHEGDGYIVGAVIGYLFMQLSVLKTKILNLEKQLKRKSSSSININQNDNFIGKSTQSIKSVNLPTTQDSNNTSEYNDSSTPKQGQIADSVADLINNNSQSIPLGSSIIKEEANSDSNEKSDTYKAELPQNIIESKHSGKATPIKTQPTAVDLIISKLKSLVVGYFTGGNSLVRTGMLVLFIGVGFLLKYVAERTIIPIEYRYIAIGIACFVMLMLGWKLRKKRPGFALSLEGGGIGLLYLTLFSALRLHNLLPEHIVFLLLIVIVLLSSILAIYQDSMALAIIGMIGGFAAPILTSTGSGSHVQLFSYYLLLNIGIFSIAWFKSWRILNVIGFLATFGIGSIWGYQYYKPEFFNSVEPFLIAYFLLYTFIAVLFAIKQRPKLKGINDGTVIFGTPLVGFALQAALMKDSEYGLAYSALALGIFYVFVAYILKSMKKPYMKGLIESFIALGIGFGTLAIPLGFDGRVTSAMWAVEGCALLWVGIRQSRIFPRFSGCVLTLLGMLAFFIEEKASSTLPPWLNADYVGTLMIVLSSAFIALYARRSSHKLLKIEGEWVPLIMSVFSLSWWVYGGMLEIHTHYSTIQFMLFELFLASTAVALLFIAEKAHYNVIKILSFVVAMIMVVTIVEFLPHSHPEMKAFANVRFLGLLILSLSHLYLSWYWQRGKTLNKNSMPIQISNILFVIAISVWTYIGHNELFTYFSSQYFINLSMVFMSVSFICWLLLAEKLNWKSMHLMSNLLLPYLIVVSYYILAKGGEFHEGYGIFVWLFSGAVNYWILKKYDKSMLFKAWYHLVSLLLFVFITVFEFNELMKFTLGGENIWQQASAVFMLLLITIVLYTIRKIKVWPFKQNSAAYFVQGVAILSVVTWLMVITLNLSVPKQSTFISYIPILNIIDIIGIIFVYFIWKVLSNNSLKPTTEIKKFMVIALTITTFFILNTSMLRSLHFWYSIDYKFNTMLSSFLVQSAFSILWSLTAVILMVISAQKHWRTVWLIGLGLMITVVVKLFLVDMSASGTVERIVAFLSVGILLSLVGYFSPLPPDIQKEKQDG